MAGRPWRYRSFGHPRLGGEGRPPGQVRFGAVSRALSLAHMSDKAEWRDAVIRQRLLLFVEGAAVGPAIHIYRGRISDIRRPETETADGPFCDRNATFLGKYTDRDQQMRAPGDRGCECVALYETSGAEFTGWLQQ